MFSDLTLWPGVQARVAPGPLRIRATIVIDVEAQSPDEIERAKAQIMAQHQLVRRVHADATLEFRQRKPRQRPRAAAPTRIVMPYLDD